MNKMFIITCIFIIGFTANLLKAETPGESETAIPDTQSNPLDDYTLMHQVSEMPRFNEQELIAAIVYPSIAYRARIEGRVVLELYIDKTGTVQRIRIIYEEPKGHGFGEAALKAFAGRQGTPAFLDGEPVNCRYRYPVDFRLR